MDQKAFLRTDEIVCGIAEPEWCSLYITLEISKTGLCLICSLLCILDSQEIFLANVILFFFKCNLFGSDDFCHGGLTWKNFFLFHFRLQNTIFPRKLHVLKFSNPVFFTVLKILNISNLKNNNLQDCCPTYQLFLSSYTSIWQPNTHTV